MLIEWIDSINLYEIEKSEIKALNILKTKIVFIKKEYHSILLKINKLLKYLKYGNFDDIKNLVKYNNKLKKNKIKYESICFKILEINNIISIIKNLKHNKIHYVYDLFLLAKYLQDTKILNILNNISDHFNIKITPKLFTNINFMYITDNNEYICEVCELYISQLKIIILNNTDYIVDFNIILKVESLNIFKNYSFYSLINSNHALKNKYETPYLFIQKTCYNFL